MRTRSPLRRWAALGLLVPLVALAAPRDDARRLFLSGLDAVEQGDYEAALEDFLQAQQLYPHAATAFNIARAYEDIGEQRKALHWYRRFQVLAPERASEATPAMKRLQARLDGEDILAPPAPAPPALAPTELEALRARVRDLEAANRALQAQVSGEPADLAPPDVDLPTLRATDAPPAPATQGSPAPGDAPEPVPPGPAPEPEPPRAAFQTDAYERVITTASRYGQDPLDAPSTVTVLTADDIEASGAIDIADVLRRVPGVEVMSLTAANPSVSIRGFGAELSNKVLWLVDGRPVAWDFLASPFPLNLPFSLAEIERIEVIRGPGAAVYGANAMTGVIHIITRRPGTGPAQQLSFTAGFPNVLRANALSSGQEEAVSWRVSAGYEQHGRWTREGEDVPAQVTPFRDDQDTAGRKLRANARLDWRFADKGYGSLAGGYTNGFSEFTNTGALGRYGLEGQTHFLRGDLSYGPLHVRSFWNREEVVTGPWLQPTDTPRDLDAQVRNDLVDVEADGTFEFGNDSVHNQFILGAGYTYKDFRFDYLQGGYEQPWIEHHGKFFFQNQLRVKWFGLVAALRIDAHPLLEIADTLSPRGALLFRVAKQTSLRITGGTSYRAPSAVESYMDFNLPTTSDALFIPDFGSQTDPGADAPRPERLVTAELGLHDRSSAFHELDVAVYWNRVTDLIGLRSVTPALAPYDDEAGGWPVGSTGWVNQSDLTYDAFGGEVELSVFPVTGLDVFANVAVQRVLEREGDSTVQDGSSSFVKVNGGIAYRSPVRVDVSVSAHYLTEQTWRLRGFDAAGQLETTTQPVPARFLMSARLAARPIPKSDLQLAISLWNPLGFTDPYREHPKGQLVGPRVLGTVSFAF